MRITHLLVLATLLAPPALRAQEGPPQGTPQDEATTTPPFTAEQIRDYTKAGRRYTFRVEEAGQPARFMVIEFVSVSQDEATMRHRTLDADRKPVGEPEPDEVIAWTDLEAHARFPKAQTTRAEAEVEVPAGKFKCVVFTVREADVTSVFTFAKDLPGAPIRVELKEGDQVVHSMVLVEHVAGR